MNIKIYSKDGKEKTGLKMPTAFSKKVSDQTVADYINYIRDNLRNPIANSKDRSEVSGGGKKPWRQKGTGHARVGSSRSPLWVHGGVTFGPTNDRNFVKNMSKKARLGARRSIFLHFIEDKRFMIIDEISLTNIKTKDAEGLIETLGLEGKISLFLSETETKLMRAFRNLPYIIINQKNNLDILNIISSNWILMSKNAFYEIFPIKEEKDDVNNIKVIKKSKPNEAEKE